MSTPVEKMFKTGQHNALQKLFIVGGFNKQMNLTWTNAGARFRFQTGEIICEIEPAQPQSGARISLASPTTSGLANVFAVPALSSSPVVDEDSFVRQADLSLRYEATKELPTSVSVVWRLQDPVEWLGSLNPESLANSLLLECVISFQTDLLDALPVQEVFSRLPAGSLLPVPPLRVARPGEIDWPTSGNSGLVVADGRLFLSVVFPTDLRWIATSREGNQFCQQFRLRAENLEKGVIRRLRCFVAIGPESLRKEFEKLPDRFADSRLPLSV